jgi:glycosyltransferase involved in cell wall biosynthesis
VRQFVVKFADVWGFRALVIHLEDNEVAIFERFTGQSVEEAALAGQEWPKGIIHPARYRAFLESAQGITLVHRCLEPLAPSPVPRHELVPVMDFEFFANGARDGALSARLGIPHTTSIVAFNGNDHAAVALDIRQLHEAVELLIERGRDIVLVRTGHVLPANYEGLQFRPGPRCIELGFIERSLVPEVMRLADVVIQPGDADAFNSFRLPAKVPEYLSMSKPLIIGTCNIGTELAEAGAALVLPLMSPHAMADAAESLLDRPDEAAAKGAAGREFSHRRFRKEDVIPALEAFYDRCLAGE